MVPVRTVDDLDSVINSFERVISRSAWIAERMERAALGARPWKSFRSFVPSRSIAYRYLFFRFASLRRIDALHSEDLVTQISSLLILDP
jgi:hypothetical protein